MAGFPEYKNEGKTFKNCSGPIIQRKKIWNLFIKIPIFALFIEKVF